MQISAKAIDGQDIHLSISGRITQAELDEQQSELARWLDPEGPPRTVLLDLSESEYVDSSGLSWLLVWHKRLREAGAKLVIHSISPVVMDVLKIMRLNLVLDVAEDEAAAESIARGDQS